MAVSKQQTLELLKSKIEQHGDLPIFSASVNSICTASSDPDVDIMYLSQEVLKDASLSIKLLRLVNTPYYSRGANIGVVSKAILLLGFETVKNLCLTLKMIDSFQNEHPGIDMDRLLVKSFISSTFVRDIALKIGVNNAEESYTCALLHELGEISVATYLPDKYIEIDQLNKEAKGSNADHEQKVLGSSLLGIGKELAQSWDFPSMVVSTMDTQPVKIQGQISKTVDLNKVLSSYSSRLVGSLYTNSAAKGASMRELMLDLSTATGLNIDVLNASFKESFQMSCDLAKTYGLSAKNLNPVVADTGDDARDKLANQLSFIVTNELPKQSSNKNTSSTNHDKVENNTDSTSNESPVNHELQLQFIQEITALITDSAKLNTVLIKALDGVHVAAGFPRVVLCLLGMDRKSYSGRIAIGTDKDLMKDFFTLPVDPNNDIFSRVIVEGTDVLVEDSHDERWQKFLPKKYHNNISANGFVVAPLKSGKKPIGFVYADLGPSKHRISSNQHKAFIQFIAQVRLAFQTCR